MKLNCGPSLAVRAARRELARKEWHSWFAWHPVRVGPNECVWLQRVERKGTLKRSWHEHWWDYEYRTLG